MKLTLLNLLLFFSSLVFCQGQEINYKYNYTPLKSQGEIPEDFKKLASEKYTGDINSSYKEGSKFINKKKKFLLFSNYEINQTLFSGRVLFGDKITVYLNKVLDEILKDDTTLREKIRIYTFKSSTLNAACTSNGTIFINIGLLPYLDNEAELAFIISHEISHFVKEHSLNQYIEKEAIFEAKESFDQKINKLFTQSKEKEIEADSLGTLLFLKSNYNAEAVSTTLTKLYYSYLPYTEIPFNKNFLNTENFRIPSSFFLDSLAPISPIGLFNDRYLSHPHVSKRKEKTSILTKNKKDTGKLNYIISKQTFTEIQELSKFENIRLSLLQKQYGNVIYYAHDLLQKYPNNSYLKVAVCKSLYGLSKYKNLDTYQEVAKSYHRTEGEIQQVHYLLRKLNRSQINVLTIKYIQKTLTQHPDNSFIKELADDLIEDLVIVHRIKVKEYFNSSIDIDIINDKKLFHKNAFVRELKSENFITSFNHHYQKLDSINNWDNLDYKTKVKLQELNDKKLKKEGLPFEVNKAIAIDPFYKVYYKGTGSYIKSESKKIAFEKQITTASDLFNLDLDLINSKKLSSEDLDSYNDLSLLKEWMNEKWCHQSNKITPLFSDQISNIVQKHKTKHLIYTGVYEAPPNSYYFLILYDLKSGKMKFNDYVGSRNISKGESFRLIKDNIEYLKK